jgi:GGDEF domain-containing protein
MLFLFGHGESGAEQVKITLGEPSPDPSEPRITVSMGVAVAKGPTKVEELLSRTDDALYRAKRNGRNRVESDQSTTDDRTPEMTAPPATIP